MKRGWRKFLCAVLAVSILVSGCGLKQSANKDWVKDAVLYEVNIRQYTPEGTFAAFSEHLDELAQMGITTLWFMPIHPISETNRSGTLGSYYSVSDYKEVNPEFGTKEDFKALVDAAHSKGFHVMLDWVANHTGWDNPWLSEHPDWYTQKDGQIISPEGMGWPDVADLNYDNADMRKEMISCMSYWVKEYDVDGFRCDYAPGVPKDFWEEARTALEEIKPIYMLEEDLGWASRGLLENAFDSNYNSKVYGVLVDIARGRSQANKIKLYLENLPEGVFVMNYLNNHDLNSYERTIREGFREEVLPAMFSTIFTLPGIPMIYSGDEIGYDKAIAFMEKDPIRWETATTSYRDLIVMLSNIRKENKALHSGNYGGDITFATMESRDVLAFLRSKEDNTVVFLCNMSDKEQKADVSEFLDGSETVLLYGKGETYTKEGTCPAGEITLAPWEFYILSKNGDK